MPHRFVDNFRAGPGWNCSKAVYKLVWHIPAPSIQWINSWWWAEELPETRRVSCRHNFGKLVHLVSFIVQKFVKMHGHMNIKNWNCDAVEYSNYHPLEYCTSYPENWRNRHLRKDGTYRLDHFASYSRWPNSENSLLQRECFRKEKSGRETA